MSTGGREVVACAGAVLVPEPWRVSRVRRETHDTVTLTLAPPGGPARSLPGQFNMLYAFAVGEVAISLSGDPVRDREAAHTVKAVGRVSEALCRLRTGQTVGVRGPFGQPWPMDALAGADLLLIAGGLGLAPLRPALCHVLHHRTRFGSVALLAGARTPADLLFRRDLSRWSARRDLEVLTIVDRAGPGWKGRVGVVPALLAATPIDTRRTAALVCGPEVMMRFTVRELLARGLGADRIYLSLERNMKCAVGTCGHCQYGPEFVCRGGPVFRFDRIEPVFWIREL